MEFGVHLWATVESTVSPLRTKNLCARVRFRLAILSWISSLNIQHANFASSEEKHTFSSRSPRSENYRHLLLRPIAGFHCHAIKIKIENYSVNEVKKFTGY